MTDRKPLLFELLDKDGHPRATGTRAEVAKEARKLFAGQEQDVEWSMRVVGS